LEEVHLQAGEKILTPVDEVPLHPKLVPMYLPRVPM
jgi:hypothetical protein